MAEKKRAKTNSFFVLAMTALMIFLSGTSICENQNRLSAVSVARSDETDMLIAGGIPFGIRLQTEGVVVVAVGDVWDGTQNSRPAGDAGIRRGDFIIAVGEEKITEAAQFCDLCKRSDASPVRLTVRRGEKEKVITVIPSPDKSGAYKLGIWIKDCAAGIGTVTFINPQTGYFGGLGHGICEPNTGELLPFASGFSEKVEITGVVVGQAGTPGELRGRFLGEKTGVLRANRPNGIYGTFFDIPADLKTALYPVGKSEDIHEGKAYLIATVGADGRRMYEIELCALDKEANSKNFTIRVTDNALLNQTGGIVQGMSGSPIIQDGKLVGAVTHVLIGDPTMGYGILIERMLTEQSAACYFAA